MTANKKTNNIYLRNPQLSDQNEYLDKALDSQQALLPWIKIDPTEVYFKTYLLRLKRNNVGYFVCLKSNDEIIGVININEIVQGGFQNGYLGYYAFEEFQGKGFMKPGLTLVLKEAFQNIKLHRLEANIQPENKASIFLVKSCGFKKEGFSPRYLKVNGRWRDHERWAITSENWKHNLN